MKSILQKKENGRCYLCMILRGDYDRRSALEEHHIFGGPLRRQSEKYGLKVYLCIQHHREGPEAVHQNVKNMRLLQKIAQREFEKKRSREEFVRIFGRNYREDENGAGIGSGADRIGDPDGFIRWEA
ncbi:MAG: hypothetical protein Q4C60_09595 [Eubacteriales bacterium]|nr:hypothetical protein [Eubacteriales bacterium]